MFDVLVLMDSHWNLKTSGCHCFGVFASIWATCEKRHATFLKMFIHCLSSKYNPYIYGLLSTLLSSPPFEIFGIQWDVSCLMHGSLPGCRCTWTARSSVCCRGKVGGRSGCRQDCSSRRGRTVSPWSSCGGSLSTSERSASPSGPPEKRQQYSVSVLLTADKHTIFMISVPKTHFK